MIPELTKSLAKAIELKFQLFFFKKRLPRLGMYEFHKHTNNVHSDSEQAFVDYTNSCSTRGLSVRACLWLSESKASLLTPISKDA